MAGLGTRMLMRHGIQLIFTAAIGMALCLGCAMLPNNTAPQDPFVVVEPGLAPQRRSRPEYPPLIEPMPVAPQRTMPRSIPEPYSSPPPTLRPNRETLQAPRRAAPRTFADPDRAPEPIAIPPREASPSPDDSEPQRTEKPMTTEPPAESLPAVDGPQLMPLDEASSALPASVPEVTEDGRLELRVEVPQQRPVGSGAQFHMTLRNLSGQVLRNVSVLCDFDDALSFPDSERKSVTHKIPRIDAGGMKDSLLTLIGTAAGRHECRFSVLIGSKVALRKTVAVEFITRQLDWQLHGPAERTVGSRAEFNIPLINISDHELRDLKIRVNLDAALTVREMTQGGRLGDRTLTWEIDRLQANEGLLLQLEVECLEPTTQACLQVTVSGADLPEDETEACLAVKSRSGSLEVRIHDVADPVAVGDEAEFVVTIQNEGLQAARDIAARCTWPEGLEFVSAKIQQGGHQQPAAAVVDGRTATLPALKKLDPSQSIEYRLRLKGRTAGTHRVTVSVANSSDKLPVSVMEPVMVHK